MASKRIARLARDAFLNKPLFRGFTDIRKNPSIKLQTILMSLFLTNRQTTWEGNFERTSQIEDCLKGQGCTGEPLALSQGSKANSDGWEPTGHQA